MIIDCHGHYTTVPAGHSDWREAQKAAFKAGETPPPYPAISDDEIRESLEKNQIRLIRERRADMTIFSPAPRRWRRMSATRRSRRNGRGSTTTSSSAASISTPRFSRASACCRRTPGRT